MSISYGFLFPCVETEIFINCLLKYRCVVFSVQEKHFIADPQGSHTHVCELSHLTIYPFRAPETHPARIGGINIIGVINVIDDVDHAKITPKITTQ